MYVKVSQMVSSLRPSYQNGVCARSSVRLDVPYFRWCRSAIWIPTATGRYSDSVCSRAAVLTVLQPYQLNQGKVMLSGLAQAVTHIPLRNFPIRFDSAPLATRSDQANVGIPFLFIELNTLRMEAIYPRNVHSNLAQIFTASQPRRTQCEPSVSCSRTCYVLQNCSEKTLRKWRQNDVC
jgi:hypothetical protein